MKDADFLKGLSDQAAIDQALVGFGQFAYLLFAYKTKLVGEGFTEKQAMQIVLEFQAVQLSGGAQNGSGGK